MTLKLRRKPAGGTEAAILRYLAVAVVLMSLGPATSEADSRIATYNLLFYDSGSTARHPSFITVLAALDADVLCVQEIANASAVNQFLTGVLNATGGPGAADPYVAATFTETGTNLDVALYYRPNRFTEIPSGYQVIPSSAPRDTFRWRLRPVEDSSGANDVYIYGMHLAASDASQRALQAADARANANALPAGSHFIYLGDLNLQNTSEGAYQQFVGSQADNDGRAFDPLNPFNVTQNWSGNGAFAIMHTQSPHANNPDPPPGAVSGGLDDRFDLLLISYSLNDGAAPDYVSGTYKAFGNDGQHFNNDINDPPTIPEGTAMANALHATSDHLPVYLDVDFQIISPPIITTPSFLNVGAVLVGGTTTAPLTVQNSATTPGLDLEYSMVAPANFLAPAGTFTLAPGASTQHTIAVFGVTPPVQSGNLVITNNSANAPTRNVLLAAEVKAHAIPSTVPDSQVTAASIDFGAHPLGEFSDQVARVYNANYVINTSVPLSIYDANFTGEDQSRFILVGFAPTAGITSFADITVRFVEEFAVPGSYSATLNLLTRDDSLLNGATNLATIQFHLSATISDAGQIPGDFDSSGSVDLPDVDPMIALLLDPPGASPADRLIGDMNEDGENDGLDLPLFVDALLGP